MGKLLGYIIAIIGLVIIALGFVTADIPLISGIPKMYVMFAGIIIIIAGIALSLGKSSSKVKQSEEEVPIYEGAGKHKKIVGYRRGK